MSEEFTLTHTELVGRAARWLRGTKSCGVVLTELVTQAFEIPDAIGWKNGGRESHLVECKTSRSDYLQDIRHKLPHREGRGMGVYRWFMTPPGLVDPDELPPNWGMLWVYERIVRVKHEAVRRSEYHRIKMREIPVLYSALRRVQGEG